MVLAAASNLLTSTFGTYFTLFISLPLAVASSRFLEPLIGRTAKRREQNIAEINSDDIDGHSSSSGLSFSEKLLTWFVTSVMAMAANWVAFNQFNKFVLLAYFVMIAISAAGDMLYFSCRKKNQQSVSSPS
ncbi:hypothetical protein CUN67_26335 (plasmid) [Pantoea cypripedii]|uniref:Uncharacterized protein n=2 Tax=Pantoea cypripedii TaxID=55209 RepID=A0A6B9G4A2_PANCY|nr:hypothetical protein CUN67_26335 [Pantoea cypripedii]